MVITFSNIRGGGGATGGTVSGITLWSDETTKAYIDNALSGVTDVLSAYTKTEDFATINGSAITSGGNLVIEETPYTAGTNIDITDHIISVTGITIPSKVSDLQNDLNFVNSADVKTQIEGYNYINSSQAQTQIDNSISGKLDTDIFTTYTANTKTELNNKQDISGMTEYATTAFTESTYLKEHQSLSAYSTTEQVQTLINTAKQEVENEIPDVSDFVTSAQVETQITDKGYLTGYTETDPVFQASAASGITSQDISNWNNKLDSSDLEPYYTSAQTDTAISNATSGKQDTLVSGVNIKTINNESLLGSGNIVIQGGSGGGSYTAGDNIDITNDVISVTGLATINGSAITEGGNIVIQGGSGGGSNIIELTQAEYDALTAYTEDAIYVITDSQAINMDNYATTGALDSYYTSAETDTAISNAVSGKTDKISVTASSSGYKFPKWNNQGCITGTYSTAYQASQSINGSSRTLYSTSSSSLPTIYAPTSAGSAGQPLLSNGSGAPVWGSYKFQFISQSQYDALTTKDSTTIYFIVNEN